MTDSLEQFNPLDDAIAALRLAWAEGRPAVVAVNPSADNFTIANPVDMRPHEITVLVPGAYFAYVAPKP